jgi:hypothetical protein
MEWFRYDLAPAELESWLEKSRAAQFRLAERQDVPFTLLLMAGLDRADGKMFARALAEALDSYSGWMTKKGDSLLLGPAKDRKINREQLAASMLTQQLRALLCHVPDSSLPAMVEAVTNALETAPRRENASLDYVRDEVHRFREELAAAFPPGARP